MSCVAVGLCATVLVAFQTLSKDEQDAYAKRPAVQVSGGDQYRIVEIKTRPWVIQTFQLRLPPGMKAIAIYFAGDDGLGGAIQLEQHLPRDSIGFATVEPPSDLPRGFRDGGFRSSVEHVTDIESVVGYLRREFSLPVWLIGMSMGSVSVANLATSGRVPVDGIVLLSPVSAPTASGNWVYGETPVTGFALGKISVPLLVVANSRDGCAMTPSSGAADIAAAATAAPTRQAKILNGGFNASNNPCTGTSFHTFGGMRDELGRVISAFIIANPPTKARPAR